uniref:Calpain catalytic domain-containing protein n=1 Tax=Anolis carolinensis TaxID=28377 RepID=H9GHD2_ANOCA
KRAGRTLDKRIYLYKDLSFPANDDSLFFNYSTPLAHFRGEICWLRPQEICSLPRLFSDNHYEWQVKQGMLGDCWFLCACAALQKSKYLLAKVIPPGQPGWRDEKYRGCFTCRIWQFGHWVEVTIDDRLPCLGGKLCFSQCQMEDVFWLPLLEKAYAKNHNNDLFLLHWGVFYSRGPGWSQLDPVVAAELLSQIQEGEFWVEEEEFFAEFDEIITGYPITEEGQLQSLYTDRVLSHTQKLYGSWVRGQSAGGCRNNSTFPTNPKFWLRVCEQSEVCIALLQKHRKHSTDWAGRIRNWPRLVEAEPPVADGIRGKNYHAVGLHLWKVEKKQFNLPKTLSMPPISGTVCHSYNREVHLHCDLSPGYYLVVPSTFLNDAEGNFLLRVFASGRISLSEIKLPSPDNAIREELPGGEWETARMEGRWRKGQSAGGSRNFPSFHSNPRLPLSVPPGAGQRGIHVALRQHCPDNKCHPIGFHIFQVSGCGSGIAHLALQPVVSCVPHSYSQEVSQFCRLPSGNYAIVPSTYLPDTEGTFTVIVATKIER